MKQEQLQAIKERANKAGDFSSWEAVDSNEINQAKVVTKGLGGYTVGIEMSIEDAQFIAHARQDVPALIAEVERLSTALVKIAYTPSFETLQDVEKYADEILEGE